MRAAKPNKKLASIEDSRICLKCGECCKRYWITVLPSEAKKISRLQKRAAGDFLKNDCELNIKLFTKTTPGVLTFPSTFFPKRIFEILKKEIGVVPESFFIVPQVVLKRTENIFFDSGQRTLKKEKYSSCVYLLADNKCKIYPKRPSPCKLFPFIAMPDFRQQYPFCGLYRKISRDTSVESRIYYKSIQHYFKEVDKRGFLQVWRRPPKSGFIFLGEKNVGEISIDELMQMMPKIIRPVPRKIK